MSKVRHLSSFVTSAPALVSPVPAGLVRRVAPLVPIVECALASLVLIPSTRRVGFLASGALLAGFLVILARAWRRGTAVGCACFGNQNDERVTGASLVRTGMLMAVALGTGSLQGMVSTAVPVWTPSLALALGMAAALLVGGALISDTVRLLTTVEQCR